MKQFHRTYETPRLGITAAGTRLYRAKKKNCEACDLKRRCCPKMPMRKVPRDIHEDARDVARAIASTPEYEQSRHRRKKVEMLFAISNAFCGWHAWGCEVHAEHAMNFCSQRPPKT